MKIYAAVQYGNPKATEKFFVPVPGVRGHYMMTDRSVVIAACPFCKSPVGQPCVGKTGFNSGTHYPRRDIATRLIRNEGRK